MRVIAGEFRGRLLKMPKGAKMRPTKDMLKETLFNVLGKKICGASFLELFAGSGSIGIEAKSRGAKVVIFIENNRPCIKTIEENLTTLGIIYSYKLDSQDVKKRISVILVPFDAERAIRMLYQKGQKFDFVFLDPPYYQEDKLKNCLIKMCLYDILKPHSLVIAEHNKGEILPRTFVKLKLLFSRGCGDAVLSFYQKR